MQREEIVKVLFEALQRAKQQKMELSLIKDEADLRKDLGLDSLAMIETVWEVEEKLGIYIDENKIKTIFKVGDVVNLVEELVKAKESGAAQKASQA